MNSGAGSDWWHRLRERGVIRVAASYAVIAWLLLQIADVTFEPLGVPRWANAAGRWNTPSAPDVEPTVRKFAPPPG